MSEDYFKWDVIAEGGREYVDSGENGVLHEGEVYADDLGACVGVAVYDPEKNHGYLSHLDTIARENDDILAQLDVFLNLTPDILEPEVAVVGGRYPDVEDTIDTDLRGPTACETYNVGGIKTVIARIVEENFENDIEFDFPGKRDTELYIDAEEGIEINHIS